MPDQFTLLLEWRRNEAAVRGLAKLPRDFYTSTQGYLSDLKRSYESDLRENPSGRKGEISRQTYHRASSLARDVVEGRVQKILTAAFQASIGGSRDLPNALAEERSMFDQVLGVLLDHRRSVAAYLEPASPGPSGAAPSAARPPPSAQAPPSTASAPPEVSPAPIPPPPAARPEPSLAYVRIVRDGRPIEVGSETLDLRADDIVSLPAETARLLIEARIAEPVTTNPTRPTA
jgi:DNA replication initiation complex subunit (GINS family)